MFFPKLLLPSFLILKSMYWGTNVRIVQSKCVLVFVVIVFSLTCGLEQNFVKNRKQKLRLQSTDDKNMCSMVITRKQKYLCKLIRVFRKASRSCYVFPTTDDFKHKTKYAGTNRMSCRFHKHK